MLSINLGGNYERLFDSVNADGRRGATYAAGVHYYVDDKGNAINGSVNIRKLLNDGYVFVETDDYLNLLG